MNIQIIFCICALLVINKAITNASILSVLLNTAEERAAILQGLKNKDYVLVLIKIIELKLKVYPPQKYSAAEFWLLLTKNILIKIHPHYLRIQAARRYWGRIRDKFQEKKREIILKHLKNLKLLVEFVQKRLDDLISKFDTDDVENSDVDVQLIGSTLDSFRQLAGSILSGAAATIKESKEESESDESDSSSTVTKDLEESTEAIGFENKTTFWTRKIEVTLTLCYIHLEFKFQIYYKEERN